MATAFQKVLELISPTSIVAVPECNKFLVHCDTALFSYPLDLVVRVSQGHATHKILGDSAERLAQKDGSVLFFKVGRVGHRTLSKDPGLYPAVSFLTRQSRLCSKVILARYVTCTGINSSWCKHKVFSGSWIVIPVLWFCPYPLICWEVKPLTFSQQPMPIPRDAHDAIFLSKKVAICAPKVIHIVKPMKWVHSWDKTDR